MLRTRRRRRLWRFRPQRLQTSEEEQQHLLWFVFIFRFGFSLPVSIRFKSLGSGSAGNATLVEAREGLRTSHLLIDCGMSQRKLTLRLQQAGVEPEQIDALFITHEHSDHIGCGVAFAQRHGIPLWMSRGTHVGIGQPELGELLHMARDGSPLCVGALECTPFTVPHDAREPLQLRCTDGDRLLGIVTDLGHASAHVVEMLQGCDALLIEANHDPDLRGASRYPPFLKARVAGDFGHLSNAASAGLARLLQHARLGQVLAGHLSERNNRPDLASAALAEALGRTVDDIMLADAAHGSDWLSV